MAGAHVFNSAKCKIPCGEIEYGAFIFHLHAEFLFEWNALLQGFMVGIKEVKGKRKRNILHLRLLKVVCQRAFKSTV